MSLLNFEGFDIYGTATGTGAGAAFREKLYRRYKCWLDQGSNKVYPDTGYDGNGISVRSDNNYNTLDIPFLADQYGNTIIIGIRFKVLTTGTWQLIDIGSLARETITRISIISGDQVRIYRGTGTTLGTSAADVFDVDSWYFMEIKLTLVQGASGAYDIRVDDSSVLSGSFVDIMEGTETRADYFRIWFSTVVQVDDIYVINTNGPINNDWLGQYTFVEPYYPNEDGSNTDWTPSTGVDHYAVIDEAAESTSDYLTGSTLNDVDTFKFEDVDNVTIFGTKVDAYIGYDVTAGVRSARIKCISGVTTSNGDTFGIADQINHVESRILETDPDTGSLWTSTGLNAAEFGVEVMS